LKKRGEVKMGKFICTQQEMMEALSKASHAFSHSPRRVDFNKLDEDDEQRIVRSIKLLGSHIGDPEARMILQCLKMAAENC